MKTGAYLIGIALSCVGLPAQATVTISSAATQNMSCSGGVCIPTATDANLNVSDLQTFLKSGNLEVTTTGNGIQATDIAVTAKFSWSKSTMLSLDTYHSIAIVSPVGVNGQGGVSLVTNDGGTGGVLAFTGNGSITFKNLASALTINGASYTLVGNITTLASDIASNPTGNFAVAANYDASGDGTYGGAPVQTQYGGVFEGLGNIISNLSINDANANVSDGLFSFINFGTVSDLSLDYVSVTGASTSYVGGIVGRIGSGTIRGSHVSGTIVGGASTGGLAGEAASGTISYSTSSASVSAGNTLGSIVGGLVGLSSSTISYCYSIGAVTGGVDDAVGGLVGFNDTGGLITLSFATGSAAAGGGGSVVGGLVGQNQVGSGVSITDSYATGAVTDTGGGTISSVGGLIGTAGLPAAVSYSSGKDSGAQGDIVGGFVGNDYTNGQMNHDYWDKTASGITNNSQGAGNIANDPGLKGLGNEKFKDGLPKGFKPSIWAESKGVNGGLPYLIDNPPP